MGNIHELEALKIAHLGLEAFNLKVCDLEKTSKLVPVKFPANSSILYSIPVENEEEVNSAVAELY